MVLITPFEDVIPEFLYYQFISNHFQEQMKSKSKNYSISRAQFANLYIELPSLKKQEQVVDALEANFSALYERAIELTFQLQKAELIRREAFLNAFEGRSCRAKCRALNIIGLTDINCGIKT